MLPWKRLIRPLAALCLAAAATVVPATAARAADTAAAHSYTHLRLPTNSRGENTAGEGTKKKKKK
ncbi:hypothetical protein PV338_19020, partial [Streptomyces scabiei]|nr:hypothetical protein [Streptomyces scabiei]